MGNSIAWLLSLERNAFVSLPDMNYSTFIQVVDPFILATPRGISHDHGQVRFNANSKHWFPAADSTSCNGVRIFHVRGTISNGRKKWQLDSCRLDLTQWLSGNIKKPYCHFHFWTTSVFRNDILIPFFPWIVDDCISEIRCNIYFHWLCFIGCLCLRVMTEDL